MDALKKKKYIHSPRKRFDPIALTVSTATLLGIMFLAGGVDKNDFLIDTRSIFIVIGGTFAIILFQFDFISLARSFAIILQSFIGTPDRKIISIMKEIDDAILTDVPLGELRSGEEITGELLNDIVFMFNRGLTFDEIDAFVGSRISDEFFARKTAVGILNRAALVAPALGLFGTVLGLIGVLKSLSSPAEIGPSMALALMTTAYGAGFGSLIFTPLAGRLEHHNNVHVESHEQILAKIAILLKREERSMTRLRKPEVLSA